jgi:CheY-like chemotaxis protein
MTMMESKALEALFPGTRRIVLSAMFGEPDRWWSVAELAGCAGVRPASLQAYIGQLRSGGVIREQKGDGPSRFQPDLNCPVFVELRAMVVKLTPSRLAGETVLVVEDTEATAQITRILLESWGYLVLEAHGAAEALDVSDSHTDEIHLLLTDVIMPGLSGPQLADELRRRRPKLRVVFMSGIPADEINGRMDAFLSKPFNPARLSQMIRKTLDDAH